MNKKLTLLLLVPLFMITAATAVPNAILEPPNGDFESWSTGRPVNWSYNDLEFWVNEENTYVHGDSSSANINLISGTSTGSFFNDWQTSEIVAGNTYTFSIWILDIDLEGVPPYFHPTGKYGNATLEIELRDGANSQVLASASSATSVTQNDWQELTCTIGSAPSGVGYVHFSVYCTKWTDEAIIYVDDASVSGIFADEFAFTNLVFIGSILIVATIVSLIFKKKNR